MLMSRGSVELFKAGSASRRSGRRVGDASKARRTHRRSSEQQQAENLPSFPASGFNLHPSSSHFLLTAEESSLWNFCFSEAVFHAMHRCKVLLLLLLILHFLSAEAYKCRCTRKGPKFRYKDVQKLEIKPKHPFCQEKMIFVTMENVSRFKGQEYCLHPNLQSTKNLVKWFRIWKDKHRVYEA